MKYIKNNFELFNFVVAKFLDKIVAIILIVVIPFIFIFIGRLIFKVDFSLVFSYVFGVYSIIVTVILFDYVIISQLKEAKFFNSKEEISNILHSLKFVKKRMLSDQSVSVKSWKDNISILNSYNKILNKNDRLYLSELKGEFDILMKKLKQLDVGYDYSRKMINFSEVDIDLSADCNERLDEIINYLRMKEELDRKWKEKNILIML